MEQILTFLEQKFLVWSMILSRVAGLFLATPLFSGWYIPVVVKVSLAVLLSWVALYSMPDAVIPLSTPPAYIAIGIFNNFMVGVVIGFMAFMLISATMSAGGIFSVQMGFMIASSFDPSAPDIPLLGNYVYLIAVYIFVALKGHLIFYQAVVKSFEKFPVAMYGSDLNFVKIIIDKSPQMFVIALQLGMAIIAFMLLVTVLLGIISRLIPQLNVFMVGLPLKVLVGLIIFLGMIPVWADALSALSGKIINWVMEFTSK